MPRQARRKGPHLAHHIVHRGINRQIIFRDDFDRDIFLRLLHTSAAKFGLSVWCYCLMDNHYHLFVYDRGEQLSEMVHRLNGMYTTKFNFRHGCEGALLRGRFFSKPVYENSYKLGLFRYIHMNPVTARIVHRPSQYMWSSFHAYASGTATDLLDTTPLLSLLGWASIDRDLLNNWMQDHEGGLPSAKESGDSCRPYKDLETEISGPQLGDSEISGAASKVPLHQHPARESAQFFAAAEAELTVIAERHGLTKAAILAAKKGQRGSVVSVRALGLLTCRYKLGLSRSELGAVFGMHPSSVGPALLRAKRQSSAVDFLSSVDMQKLDATKGLACAVKST